MMSKLLFIAITFLANSIFIYGQNSNLIGYEDARNAIIQTEYKIATGGNIYLSSKEEKVNEIFMRYKTEELSKGFQFSEINAPSMHFFKAKSLILNSKIFHFLQHMPKGALLHMHDTASVSSDFVVRNISYMPGLLRCTNKDEVSILTFRRLPSYHGCTTQYILISDEREQSRSSDIYDRNFEKLINLYTPTPEVDYPTITKVWTKFQNMFNTIYDVLTYIPAFRVYYWQMLQEMFTDNIMYGEIRMSLKELYDMSGRTFPVDRTVTELLDLIRQFRQQHPGFLGIKIILTTQRKTDWEQINNKLELFKELHLKYPNFIIGFDLVGQEDNGKPLYDFLKALINLPNTARFFFHAGETNWYGSSSDLNLVDAILLNTTRIGHGFALLRHPLLWNAVKARNIAVEINPISNQVLHLVCDLRNHPGGFYLSNNIPVVIGNDDPGFWNAKGLSFDYYYVIMSMAANQAGLKTLKSLVWNSIRYSFLYEIERKIAFQNLERSWEQFIDDVLHGIVI